MESNKFERMMKERRTFAYNPDLNERAKEMRKNMTSEERKVWYSFLKNHELKFLRQKIIDNYILDFYCPKYKLAIEIDGSQHYEEGNKEYDEIRTRLLNAYGIEVIRFSNTEVKTKFIQVCTNINKLIAKKI